MSSRSEDLAKVQLILTESRTLNQVEVENRK